MNYQIEHGFYGCETGCCGYDLNGDDGGHDWTFDHPEQDAPTDADLIAFARAKFKKIKPDDTVTVGSWKSCRGSSWS